MKIKKTTLERRGSIDTVNADTRTVRAALSSELPVKRFFGEEILVHSRKAVDLSRAADNGLPLLVNHNDQALPIGRIRNLSVDSDHVLRGDLDFSEATEQAQDAWALAREGTLSDVSIRYKINAYEVEGRDTDNETYRVTHWTVLEGSVVSVPADPSVGLGRQEDIQGPVMTDETETAPAPAPNPSANPLAAARATNAASFEAGAMAERERVIAINTLAANFPASPMVAELARNAIEQRTTMNDFKESLIVALAGEPASPLARSVPQPELTSPAIRMPLASTQARSLSIMPGGDELERMMTGIEQAMDVRAGNVDIEQARDNEFLGYSLVELARLSLERRGISTRGMSPMDVAGQSLVRFIEPGTANLATTDFPALLENVMNKALFRGFDEAPVTWNLWCGVDQARDFKPGTRPGVSQFTSLAAVAENGTVADGIVNDKKEAFQIVTYSRKFSVTRQTIVNDDLGGLADIAAKMGGAANRTVDEQAYAFIEANAVMAEDGIALFENGTLRTGQSNMHATGAAPPATATISAARVSMGNKVDSNGVVLGIVPQYMVVPLEQEEAMLVLRTTSVDPDAANVTRNNVYQQLWQPVSTPRLTDKDAYYFFGARGECIVVVFLNGNQRPMMARDEGWSVLSAHWRVVLDFDVFAIDWRAAYKVPNA